MSIPKPSTLVWRDYKTDPPVPPNGYYLVIRGPVGGEDGMFPVEAQRWGGCPGEADGWCQSDGGDEIPEDDILFWAELPEVLS